MPRVRPRGRLNAARCPSPDVRCVRQLRSVEISGGPVRTCIGCRERAQAADLLRVVLVGHEVVADRAHRLPGRGAWLHPVAGCLALAEKRRAFGRALRVSGSDFGLDSVRQQLSRSVDHQVRAREQKQVDPV